MAAVSDSFHEISRRTSPREGIRSSTRKSLLATASREGAHTLSSPRALPLTSTTGSEPSGPQLDSPWRVLSMRQPGSSASLDHR